MTEINSYFRPLHFPISSTEPHLPQLSSLSPVPPVSEAFPGDSSGFLLQGGHHPTSLLFHQSKFVSQQNFNTLNSQSHVLRYFESSYVNTLNNCNCLNTFEQPQLLKYFWINSTCLNICCSLDTKLRTASPFRTYNVIGKENNPVGRLLRKTETVTTSF